MNNCIIRKRVWFLLGIIVLCGLFQAISFAQESEFDYQRAIERATELYNEKKYAESIKAYEEVLKIEDSDPSVYYNIACCYSLMNKVEEALVWFEKSITHGFTNYGHIKNDTDLDNIRNTPKFKELIAKYNLVIEEKSDTFILRGFDPYVTSGGAQELTSYCYLAGCPKTKEAAIIDPSGGAKEIKSYLKETGLTLKYILITHAHQDHIKGLQVWLDEVKPKVYIHESDIEGFQEHLKYDDVVALKDGDKVQVGSLSFIAMHTPGHTPDSVCFYLENEGRLFSGDALNFPPSSRITPEIREYFQKNFSDVKDDTKVYMGHMGYKLFSDIKKTVGAGGKGGKLNYCDMKKTESAFKCDKCNKLLSYSYCPKCNKDAVTSPIKLNENEATVILCKCPTCGEKVIQGNWLKEDICQLCNVKKSGQYVLFCVKNVYACPQHKDVESLKTGDCSKCSKRLEMSRIVYSPRIDVYECPRCKEQTNKSGKCARCMEDKTKKRSCKDSGTFPHINEEQSGKEHSK